MKFYSQILLIIIGFAIKVFCQSDTIKYPWPIYPQNQQRNIGGTFGEYRSTSTSGHYHNGTDMSADGGTPVYAVLSGTVVSAFDDGGTGYDSYVRIASVIDGKTKYLTYYHTRPIVSNGQIVNVGDQISTIAIDHVHLIDYRIGEGISGNQINSIRPDGGVQPYNDPWKPYIRYVKFLLDNTDKELNQFQLGNKIDIIVHVEEGNGTSSASLNNGTYEIGYKLLSEDKQTVVYSPPDDGLRFRYYNIPANDYVSVNYYAKESNTSKHVYIVTNGTGASNVASTRVVQNNYLDLSEFPIGNYTIMIFTKDTRGNTDTVYIPITNTDIDLIPPSSPILSFIRKDSTNYFTINWIEPIDSDLKGYRLLYSNDNAYYYERENESTLIKGINERQYFYNLTKPLYFRLYAVDTAYIPNISEQSDTYGIRMKNDSTKILIIDGFNRFGGTGSWSKSYHDFLISHSESFDLSFESCHNSSIIENKIDLKNYNLVIWILGDESTQDETFSSIEQTKIKEYLESGGKLFITGSEIAWDMEGASSASNNDKEFLHNILKAKYINDDSNIYSVFGAANTQFSDLNFLYGTPSAASPYNEDYPDVIDTVNGSVPILFYNESNIAGIAYTGVYNNSEKEAQLIYIGFPFETIGNSESRKKLMNASLNYFGFITTDIEKEENDIIPAKNILFQNYPNPFNPSTIISFSIKEESNVKLKIFDILGKEILTLVNENLKPGNYKYTFDINEINRTLASGIFFYKLETDNFVSVNKMIYLK